MPRERKQVGLRLPADIVEQVTEQARKADVSLNRWITQAVCEVLETVQAADHPTDSVTLGVSNEALSAHADLMEKATGTRPDTVRRGNKEAPLPKVRKPEVTPVFRGKDRL